MYYNIHYYKLQIVLLEHMLQYILLLTEEDKIILFKKKI